MLPLEACRGAGTGREVRGLVLSAPEDPEYLPDGAEADDTVQVAGRAEIRQFPCASLSTLCMWRRPRGMLG